MNTYPKHPSSLLFSSSPLLLLLQRKANIPPTKFIDLDQCSIEKEEANWFQIKQDKHLFNLKFKDEDKDEWLRLCRGK